jgi:hypothetical protein
MVLKWDNNSNGTNYGFNLHNFNQDKNIFHAIYILDSYSGALFVSNKFSESANLSNTNEDLISSFLNAMNLFINEINANEEIQEINFKQMRILYERKERLMVIAISKKRDLQVEKYYVHEILNDFYYRFKREITQFNGIINKEMSSYKMKVPNIFNSRL